MKIPPKLTFTVAQTAQWIRDYFYPDGLYNEIERYKKEEAVIIRILKDIISGAKDGKIRTKQRTHDAADISFIGGNYMGMFRIVYFGNLTLGGLLRYSGENFEGIFIFSSIYLIIRGLIVLPFKILFLFIKLFAGINLLLLLLLVVIFEWPIKLIIFLVKLFYNDIYNFLFNTYEIKSGKKNKPLVKFQLRAGAISLFGYYLLMSGFDYNFCVFMFDFHDENINAQEWETYAGGNGKRLGPVYLDTYRLIDINIVGELFGLYCSLIAAPILILFYIIFNGFAKRQVAYEELTIGPDYLEDITRLTKPYRERYKDIDKYCYPEIEIPDVTICFILLLVYEVVIDTIFNMAFSEYSIFTCAVISTIMMGCKLGTFLYADDQVDVIYSVNEEEDRFPAEGFDDVGFYNVLLHELAIYRRGAVEQKLLAKIAFYEEFFHDCLADFENLLTYRSYTFEETLKLRADAGEYIQDQESLREYSTMIDAVKIVYIREETTRLDPLRKRIFYEGFFDSRVIELEYLYYVYLFGGMSIEDIMDVLTGLKDGEDGSELLVPEISGKNLSPLHLKMIASRCLPLEGVHPENKHYKAFLRYIGAKDPGFLGLIASERNSLAEEDQGASEFTDHTHVGIAKECYPEYLAEVCGYEYEPYQTPRTISFEMFKAYENSVKFYPEHTYNLFSSVYNLLKNSPVPLPYADALGKQAVDAACNLELDTVLFRTDEKMVRQHYKNAYSDVTTESEHVEYNLFVGHTHIQGVMAEASFGEKRLKSEMGAFRRFIDQIVDLLKQQKTSNFIFNGGVRLNVDLVNKIHDSINLLDGRPTQMAIANLYFFVKSHPNSLLKFYLHDFFFRKHTETISEHIFRNYDYERSYRYAKLYMDEYRFLSGFGKSILYTFTTDVGINTGVEESKILEEEGLLPQGNIRMKFDEKLPTFIRVSNDFEDISKLLLKIEEMLNRGKKYVTLKQLHLRVVTALTHDMKGRMPYLNVGDFMIMFQDMRLVMRHNISYPEFDSQIFGVEPHQYGTIFKIQVGAQKVKGSFDDQQRWRSDIIPALLLNGFRYALFDYLRFRKCEVLSQRICSKLAIEPKPRLRRKLFSFNHFGGNSSPLSFRVYPPTVYNMLPKLEFKTIPKGIKKFNNRSYISKGADNFSNNVLVKFGFFRLAHFLKQFFKSLKFVLKMCNSIFIKKK